MERVRKTAEHNFGEKGEPEEESQVVLETSKGDWRKVGSKEYAKDENLGQIRVTDQNPLSGSFQMITQRSSQYDEK